MNINLYEVKTRKIILLSNTMAIGSNLIYTAISGDLKKFDLGGLCVTLHRMITDTKFINDVKYEYLNTEMSKIYENKLKAINDKYEF